jgi:photosystem II stability/assembly factor-like uncharacterized protein
MRHTYSPDEVANIGDRGVLSSSFRIAILSLISLLILVAGCGGPADPGGPNIRSTPVAGMSSEEATIVAMVTATAVAVNQQVSAASSELEAAVLAYLTRNITTPYKDVEIKVVSQDDAYATLEVHAMLRIDADSPWDEHVVTLQFARVSGQWKVSKEGSFISLAGQATTTAQAQVAQLTATAQDNISFRETARTADLLAIHMLNPSEGWAIGEGVILHYTGGTGTWEPQHMPGGRPRDVNMLSGNDGWIVGGTFPSNGIAKYSSAMILHYNGTAWSTVEDIPADGKGYVLTAIDMVSPTEGWAVGTDTILHYTVDATGSTGGKWESVKPNIDEEYTLYDIKMISAEEGWATGWGGVIMRYTDGAWSKVESGVQDAMFSLAVVSPTDIWVVGDNAHATHYDGKTWSPSNLDPDAFIWSKFNLRGVAFTSSDDGWAVDRDSGTFFRYNNGTWTRLEGDLAPQRVDKSGPTGLNDIIMLPTGEGWAVGNKGSILHFSNGKWEEVKR